MSIDKSKYKDIEFFSNFSYLRPIYHGVQNSYTDQYGSHGFYNAVYGMPVGVTVKPPLIEFFVEHPAGYYNKIYGSSGLNVGSDSNNIYANGYWNDAPYNQMIKLHYVIYDRASNA